MMLEMMVLITDSGKHGMTESSLKCIADFFSEMVPNGLNIPIYLCMSHSVFGVIFTRNDILWKARNFRRNSVEFI